MSRQDRERRESTARRRAEKHEVAGSKTIRLPSGITFYKLKVGSPKIDIIPFLAGDGNPWAKKGELHFERTVFVHPNIGAGEDMYICPRETAGKKCPICEYRAALARKAVASEDVAAHNALKKSLEPKERQLFLLRDVNNPDKGLMILDVSFHLFGKLLDQRMKKRNYDQFYFPDGGMSLDLTVTEKALPGRKPFCEVSAIDFEERDEPLPEKLLKEAPCLDDIITIYPYDQLKAIFEQSGDADETPPEENEDEPPKKKTTKDDEEDEDEDDDEEEPPKKKEVSGDREKFVCTHNTYRIGKYYEYNGKVREMTGCNYEEKTCSLKLPTGKVVTGISFDDIEPAKKPAEKEEKSTSKPTAESAGIKCGTQVKYKEVGLCEVVNISKDGLLLTLEDDDGEIHKSIAVGDVTIKGKKEEPTKKKPPKDEDEDEDEDSDESELVDEDDD